ASSNDSASQRPPPGVVWPPPMGDIILTRRELYDRAWNTPIEKLAQELGLSGRGLGKLCARYGIPVPPRGYWSKKAAGKRVRQPALPELQDPYRQKIHFHSRSSTAMTEPQESASAPHPLVLFEHD